MLGLDTVVDLYLMAPTEGGRDNFVDRLTIADLARLNEDGVSNAEIVQLRHDLASNPGQPIGTGFYVVVAEGPLLTLDDLELVRSDAGDGGWSIHLRGSLDLQNDPMPDAPLLSGLAERIGGYWDRPTSNDYDTALLTAHERTICPRNES